MQKSRKRRTDPGLAKGNEIEKEGREALEAATAKAGDQGLRGRRDRAEYGKLGEARDVALKASTQLGTRHPQMFLRTKGDAPGAGTPGEGYGGRGRDWLDDISAPGEDDRYPDPPQGRDPGGGKDDRRGPGRGNRGGGPPGGGPPSDDDKKDKKEKKDKKDKKDRKEKKVKDKRSGEASSDEKRGREKATGSKSGKAVDKKRKAIRMMDQVPPRVLRMTRGPGEGTG